MEQDEKEENKVKEEGERKRKEGNEEERGVSMWVMHGLWVATTPCFSARVCFALLFCSFVSFLPCSLCLWVSVPCVCCNMTIILGPDDQEEAPMSPLRFCSLGTHEPKIYLVCSFLPSTAFSVGIPPQGERRFSMQIVVPCCLLFPSRMLKRHN